MQFSWRAHGFHRCLAAFVRLVALDLRRVLRRPMHRLHYTNRMPCTGGLKLVEVVEIPPYHYGAPR